MFSNSAQSRAKTKDQLFKEALAAEIAARNAMKIRFNKEACVWICEDQGNTGSYIAAETVNQLIDKMWSANIR